MLKYHRYRYRSGYTAQTQNTCSTTFYRIRFAVHSFKDTDLLTRNSEDSFLHHRYWPPGVVTGERKEEDCCITTVCSSVGQTRRALLARRAYQQCWKVRVQFPFRTLDFLLLYLIPISGQTVGDFLRVLRFAPHPSVTFQIKNQSQMMQ